MNWMNKTVIVIGLVIVVIGLAWPVLSKLPIGRLPGDIMLKKEGFSFYFPITTMIIVSLVVSIILWILRK